MIFAVATSPYALFVIITIVTILMMIDGDDDGDEIWGI